jgi:formate dehydrogenase subunit gamma
MDTLPTLSSPKGSGATGATGALGAAGASRGEAVGGRLRRFVAAERLSHWLYALFFLAALVTGLLMWIPSTRVWMAGARHALSLYHGYVGAAMIVVPLILLVALDRRRLLADVREVDRWSWNDRRWFGLAMRGYTLRGGRSMPPQGRFNAGQKVNAVLVAAMALGFAATGGILMHRQDVAPWLVSRALWMHAFLAVAAMALFAGHLAHVFVTKHGRTYLAGMVRGWIPEELARERHQRWWEQETGGAAAPVAAAAVAAAPDPDLPGPVPGV